MDTTVAIAINFPRENVHITRPSQEIQDLCSGLIGSEYWLIEFSNLAQFYQLLLLESSCCLREKAPVPRSTTLPMTILEAGDDKSSEIPFSVASVRKCEAVSKVIFRKVDLLFSIPKRLHALYPPCNGLNSQASKRCFFRTH